MLSSFRRMRYSLIGCKDPKEQENRPYLKGVHLFNKYLLIFFHVVGIGDIRWKNSCPELYGTLSIKGIKHAEIIFAWWTRAWRNYFQAGHNQRFPKHGKPVCLKNSWIIFCFYSLSIQSITSNLVFTPPVPLKWFCQNQQWPSCCQVHWLFFSFILFNLSAKFDKKIIFSWFSYYNSDDSLLPHVFCKFLDCTIRS